MGCYVDGGWIGGEILCENNIILWISKLFGVLLLGGGLLTLYDD